MCLFILAVIPRTAPTVALDDLAAKHERSFSKIDPALLPWTISNDERVSTLSRGYCDCGSALFTPSHERDSDKVERDARSLRAKGWSESKVRAWRETQGPRPEEARRRERELAGWADFLDAALALRGVPYVCLLGHWLDEEIHGADRPAFERRTHTTSELRAVFRGRLALDVLHVFRRA